MKALIKICLGTLHPRPTDRRANGTLVRSDATSVPLVAAGRVTPGQAAGTRITLRVINARRYSGQVIESFGDKETERVFHRQFSKKLPQDIQRVARRRLLLIDAATDVNDLRVPPGNRLEKLSGDRVGQYSVRINDQYRICFNWRATAAYDVEITDYH